MGDEIRNEQVSVGTSAVNLVFRASPSPRSVFTIRNISAAANRVYLMLSDTQAASTITGGIILDQGDAYSESNSEGFKAWQGNISAVASAAGATLAVMER